MSLPCINLYPGDWLRDDVAGCSLAAQGLWLRMMFVMHDSDRYGFLSKNGVAIPSEHVARRCGITLEQYTTLLSELESVGIPRRNSDGIIFSKRMDEDAKLRAIRAKSGSKGGKQNRSKHRSKIEAKVEQNAEGEDEKESEELLVEYSEAIYLQYPKKVAKPEALKAIQKQMQSGTTHAFLLERTMAFSDAVKKWPEDEQKFIPHPATWFNQQRFNDDEKTWQRKSGNGKNDSTGAFRFPGDTSELPG